MNWWIWILIGLALMLAEILTPGGFFLLFFGLGALATGALAGAGLLTTFAVQGLVFCAVSIVAILMFRRPLKERFTPASPGMPVDTMVGETAIASEEIALGATGRAELRGSSWMVRNAGDSPIRAGQRCRVERVEGLSLWIRPE